MTGTARPACTASVLLLVGVVRHGHGRWREILDDQALGLLVRGVTGQTRCDPHEKSTGVEPVMHPHSSGP